MAMVRCDVIVWREPKGCGGAGEALASLDLVAMMDGVELRQCPPAFVGKGLGMVEVRRILVRATAVMTRATYSISSRVASRIVNFPRSSFVVMLVIRPSYSHRLRSSSNLATKVGPAPNDNRRLLLYTCPRVYTRRMAPIRRPC